MQEARGVIQAKRIDKMSEGGAALRKELLNVAYRDPRFSSQLARAEVRIVKAVLNDAANAGKQLVSMARDRPWIGGCK